MRFAAAVVSCRSASGLLVLPVLASIAAQPASSQVDPCATQVIVAFSRDQGNRPSDRFVSDLARADGVRLTFLRTLGSGLYVFLLAAPDSKCRDALERLRRDARVRSVDVDQRRRFS
jgi:hypothetical protein